ncbi:astacin-like [Ochlerotatus camptorhynchus]|uniref:astacin-like n=1 Tax=Ochlerotatus camptorhynchus TaxID=644619 RepID=UPI0031D120AE
MNGYIRFLILLVVLSALDHSLAVRNHKRDGHRVPIHRNHKRGERNFATAPHGDVGRRLKHYKRGVNKTRPFEAGMGYYHQYDIMLKEDLNENAVPLGSNQNIRWPNAVVPYVITGSFSPAEVQAIQWTINHYAVNTCIRFVPHTTESVYLRIDNSESGCWSYVGRSTDNSYNLVNLQNPSCMETGTVAHEFMHALGFYHEFTRPDRDNWVKIDMKALDPQYQTQSFFDANFGKLSFAQTELYNIPYNYGSVMHYSKWGGAVDYNRPVMNNLKPWPYADFGNDTGLSTTDVMAVNYMYCHATTVG